MKHFILISTSILLLFLSGCKTKETRKALIETNFGNITVELLDSTPRHRDNFIKLVEEGFYDNLLFHRVMKGFMIQGGDPDSRNAAKGQTLGMGSPGYTIPAEIDSLHYRGALSAARIGGPSNPKMNSSGSQFFIVQGKKHLTEREIAQQQIRNKMNYTKEQIQKYLRVGGSPFLDNNYTVFGYVTEGMDVVDKIAEAKVDTKNRPFENVTMKIKMLN